LKNRKRRFNLFKKLLKFIPKREKHPQITDITAGEVVVLFLNCQKVAEIFQDFSLTFLEKLPFL